MSIDHSTEYFKKQEEKDEKRTEESQPSVRASHYFF